MEQRGGAVSPCEGPWADRCDSLRASVVLPGTVEDGAAHSLGSGDAVFM